MKYHLCLASGLVSTRESLHVGLDRTLVSQELDIGTIDQDTTLLLELDVLVSSKWSEAPVLADDDLLSTRELVHGSSESLNSGSSVGVSSSDGKENLTDVHTGDSAVRLAPCTSHTSLKSISTGTRQHFVDSDDVVWVGSDSQVETFLSGNLDEVFVGANTGGFEGFRAQLFIFVGNHVNT